ncbi:cytochrome b [Enterobacter ludwigii]|uniref:cytochrome b n=1 Tax=Enterobacter ludwigii TaxID=299767 RepID=UPI003FD01ACC
MIKSNTMEKFTPVAILLHWMTAAIWLLAWGVGFIAVTWREELNSDHFLTTTHKAIASTVIFITIVRIIWRIIKHPPSLPDSMSSLMQLVAHAGHYLLYAIALIGLPLSGWLWSSVADKPIMVLGLFRLPPLVDPAPEYYVLVKDIHITIAYIAGVLVAGHILVALKHVLFDKDGVMQSMLPWRK